MDRRRQAALDRLLEAVYQLREAGATAGEVAEAVVRINRKYDEDLAGLQMLQAELGHLTPPPSERGEPTPRVTLRPPKPDPR